MNSMKLWRNIFVMCAAMLSLTSCSSEDHAERRMTHEQKENYGQMIAGEYKGQFIVIYTNKNCKETINELGQRVREAHEEMFSDVHFDVSDYKMQQVFLQNFPVSLIANVVDEDMELSHALAEVSPMAITARYDLGYDTDYNHIVWTFTPNVMPLLLNYGGTEHHIRIEFNNNHMYYTCAAEELKQPGSFLSFARTGVSLQLKAIYDGSTLIQSYAEGGNFMHIIFKSV